VWRPALVALVAFCAAGNAGAQQKETISFEGRQKGKPVQVTATIYWPAMPGPVPALVIHHGSGGVSDRREGRFAREMVAMGVAAVVIDSFGPRGVTSTVTDQSAVTGQDFNLDALAALKALGANGRIAANRIGITGFSKGGTSALMAAHENQVAAAGVPPGYATHCTCRSIRPARSSTTSPGAQARRSTCCWAAPTAMSAMNPARPMPPRCAPRVGGSRSRCSPVPCTASTAGQRISTPRRELRPVRHAAAGRRLVEGTQERNHDRRTDGKPIAGAFSKAMAGCRTLGVSGGGNDAAAKQSMDDLKSYVRRYLLGS